MNNHQQNLKQIGIFYESLKDEIINVDPNGAISTKYQKVLMEFRELAIGLANENSRLKAVKEILSNSDSCNVGDLLNTLEDQETKVLVKIVDPDASTDDALALSKIDRISVVEINNDKSNVVVLFHKNMDVEWMPGTLSSK